MKAPDKLGLFTVIVASNELCYHTNCSRWFYVFFWSMKPHGQLQFNETQLLGSAFLDKSCLLCCVRSTIMTQNEDTSVKKKTLPVTVLLDITGYRKKLVVFVF